MYTNAFAWHYAMRKDICFFYQAKENSNKNSQILGNNQ